MYLEDPEEASSKLKRSDESRRFEIMRTSEDICFFLVNHAICEDLVKKRGDKSIDRLRSVFDSALQYKVYPLKRLLRRWNAQTRLIGSMNETPRKGLVDFYLRTHVLPADFRVYAAFLPHCTRMDSSLELLLEKTDRVLDLRGLALDRMRMKRSFPKGLNDLLCDVGPKRKRRRHS